MFFAVNNSTTEVGMKHLLRLAAVTIMSALALQAGGLTSMTIHNPTAPSSIQLDQNYPNPFNPSTRITYRLSSPAEISLKVYNLIGQEIATLDAGLKSAGVHNVKFDAGNLASGIYLYRFQSGGFVETRRMTVVK